METAVLCICFVLAELGTALLVARFCGINHLSEDE